MNPKALGACVSALALALGGRAHAQMNNMMRGVMPAATIPYGARLSAAPVDGLSAPERARVDAAVNQFLQDRVPGIS
ncbi:MAG: hypothetical protein QOF32_545, partial [Gammaproteobacteria bacterium]|nr:hypothetical protein [Gammaproteobacteria bacterium]